MRHLALRYFAHGLYNHVLQPLHHTLGAAALTGWIKYIENPYNDFVLWWKRNALRNNLHQLVQRARDPAEHHQFVNNPLQKFFLAKLLVGKKAGTSYGHFRKAFRPTERRYRLRYRYRSYRRYYPRYNRKRAYRTYYRRRYTSRR